MAKTICVWCGKEEDADLNVANVDTCEECEEYFEEHITDITKSLNNMLLENEKNKDSSEDKKNLALKSYSLITAIHILGSRPALEFKDSKFFKFLEK